MVPINNYNFQTNDAMYDTSNNTETFHTRFSRITKLVGPLVNKFPILEANPTIFVRLFRKEYFRYWKNQTLLIKEEETVGYCNIMLFFLQVIHLS